MRYMAIQNLIKGEPDWHLKINNNNTEFSNNIKEVTTMTSNIANKFITLLQSGSISSIKLIGDSLTEGYGTKTHVQLVANQNNGNKIIFNDNNGTTYYEALTTDNSWANKFRNFINTNFSSIDFVNGGIGGRTATWALANKQYWCGGTYDVVFVMLGTNDKYQSANISDYKTQLTQYLQYVHDNSNHMIVLTPNPTNDDYNFDGSRAMHAHFTTGEMDRVITNVCQENGYYHISLYREILKLCSKTGYNVSHLMASAFDPHPNEIGHDFMWKVLQSELGFIDSDVNYRDYSIISTDNIAINADFNIAQAMPDIATEIVNPSYNSYPIADCWKLVGYTGSGDAMPNIKHSRQLISGIIPEVKYCYRINVDGAGVTNLSQYILIQPIEKGVSRYCLGKKYLNITFYARSTIVGKKIRPSITLNYGTGGSPSSADYIGTNNNFAISLNTNWTKYAISYPLPDFSTKTFGTNDDDRLDIRLGLADNIQNFIGSGYIEFAKVRVVCDASTENIKPVPFDEDLKRCMRYYQKTYAYNVTPSTLNFVNGSLIYRQANVGTVASGVYVNFKEAMYSRPTITFYNPINNNGNWYNGGLKCDSAQALSAYVSETGFFAHNSQLASDNVNSSEMLVHWVADCRL